MDTFLPHTYEAKVDLDPKNGAADLNSDSLPTVGLSFPVAVEVFLQRDTLSWMLCLVVSLL